MRLKKVEISGFKSFLDRTKLVFQPGITAVVGPNGCGKSNIVDAILWAMGEMSAKSLRGAAMEDVIFNGTQDREPMGMAEVNLVFDTSDGGPAQFSENAEIMVTRRLYRTGDSEYLTNKVPCRLRDILELFMDTGVGHKAYSIIPQGKIDAVINAKPDDIRGFLEEAAGISKYKSRKKAAQRKMESTQENLVRITDITAELERQMGSLDRQAKKAQRYKEYKEEMRDLDLGVASQNLFTLQAELEENERQLRSLKDQETELANHIEAEETRLEADRIARIEAEKEIQALTEKHFAIQSRIHEIESAIEMNARNIQTIQEQRKRGEEDIASYTEQIEALEAQMKDLEEIRRALTMEVASGDADLEMRSRMLSEARERLETLRRSQEEMQSQHAALAASLEGIRQALHERIERLNDFEARLGEKKIAKTILIQELDKFRQTSFDFSKNLEDLIRARDALKVDLAGELERLRNLKTDHDEKENRLVTLRASFSRQTSRFDSLRELEANLDGYDQGVRSIMLEKENREGICGLVADIFRTPPEYEKALEAVLGPRLQYIIVKSHEEGVEAIDYLKTRAAGRGSFIPIEVKSGDPTPLPPEYSDRIIGAMMDLIEVAPEYQRIARYLLGDTIVVRDLPRAVDMWRSNGHRKTLVTLDGEVVDPVGIISGGDLGSGGILEKRREIRELEEQIAVIRRDVEEAEGECNSLEQRIVETEGHIEQSKSGYHEREMEILRHEKELERYRSESQRIKRGLDDIAQEETVLVREGERTGRRIQELKDEIASKEAAHEDISALIIKGTETIHILEDEISSQQKTLTDLRVGHASAREKLDGIEHRLKAAGDQRGTLADSRRARMAEIAQGNENIRVLEDEIEKAKRDINENHAARIAIEGEITEKRDAYERKAADLLAQENSLKEMRRMLNEQRDRLSALNLSCNALSLKIEHLVAGIDEKYSVDLFEACSNYRIENYPMEENRERAQRLRDLIARMGEVNLTAINEYEEVKQRYDFLSGQRKDLLDSIEDLEKAIQKINKTSRQRFRETFDAVNDQFQKMFPRLFKGGRAYLSLTDHPDILEAGVEIVAQPPGKKLQHMALLSGGERAMTAVSLILSLFLVKPTPFCLLDEVDSPLDDANIDRFNEIIREMSKTSQFVIITHNKRTMELADTLYGVTMEQKGVSKLVGVRLNASAEA